MMLLYGRWGQQERKGTKHQAPYTVVSWVPRCNTSQQPWGREKTRTSQETGGRLECWQASTANSWRRGSVRRIAIYFATFLSLNFWFRGIRICTTSQIFFFLSSLVLKVQLATAPLVKKRKKKKSHGFSPCKLKFTGCFSCFSKWSQLFSHLLKPSIKLYSLLILQNVLRANKMQTGKMKSCWDY